MNMPVVVGIKEATSKFKDGMKVTIDTVSASYTKASLTCPATKGHTPGETVKYKKYLC